MNIRQSLLLPAVLLSCFLSYARAQNANAVLAASRQVDWSHAGLTAGIPNRTTVCSTLQPGATAAQINSAIAGCPAGQVVFLAAGTYNISGGITFGGRSNVTLRGAGPESTILVFSSANSCNGLWADICVAGSNSIWAQSVQVQPGGSNAANWTAGYAQGTTQITLDNVAGIGAGSTIILDQANDTTDNGQFFVCDNYVSATPGPGNCHLGTETGSPGRTINGVDHSQQQIVRVTGVSGHLVTISPGLYASNWSSAKSPGAWWTGPQIAGVGIEALSLNHNNSSNVASGVSFDSAYQCWVKDVKSLDSNRNHVWLFQSSHIQVQDSYFYGTLHNQAKSYGVEYYQTSDDLIVNNIFQHVTTPIMVGPSAGVVAAYNYTVDMAYIQPPSWMAASIALHDAGAMFDLFEGNVGNELLQDAVHGTNDTATVFRNYFSGLEPGKTAATNPISAMTHGRYSNLIGNVLGSPGYHTVYEDSSVGQKGSVNLSIYVLGYNGYLEGNWPDLLYDPLVHTTLMRWGNYDTVTGKVQWNPSEVPSALTAYANSVPTSQSLPASFFLSSKPSWWGTMPWPAIGPDVTGGPGPGGHAYPNPAQACYNSSAQDADGTLTFNPSKCYPQPPASPSNLTTTVK